MLRDCAWKDWYRAQHDRRFAARGDTYEDYVTAMLTRFHPDLFNPTPKGRHGDGGCDGLAEAGSISYAAYGSRATQDAERKLQEKFESDFARARDTWDQFIDWRFVTNAEPGRLVGASLIRLQREHGANTARPITLSIWGADRFWFDIVLNIPQERVDEVLPGLPNAQNTSLAEVVPLLDKLSSESPRVENLEPIRPVPIRKMIYNGIPAATRIEFDEGRQLSNRIARWFADQMDPELEDRTALRFRDLYREVRRVTDEPREVVERLYVALAGSPFRLDARTANAAYAVTAYFFDSCHIFEEPPTDPEPADLVLWTS